MSFPEFFVAYILIMFLSVQLGWFPSLSTMRPGGDLGQALHLAFLPALTLTLVVAAHMMLTRAAIIGVLASPYIEMARLKGATRYSLIVRHALPNALAADHQCGGRRPCLSDRRRRRRRGGLRLSRSWAVDGGFGPAARRAGGAGVQPDLRGHLCDAQPDRRYPVDPHQSEAFAPR